MPDAVTDTHGLIWYLEDSPRLGQAAKDLFDACDEGEITIYVPTICLVEILYLQEKGRVPVELKARFDAELQAGTSALSWPISPPKLPTLWPMCHAPRFPTCPTVLSLLRPSAWAFH